MDEKARAVPDRGGENTDLGHGEFPIPSRKKTSPRAPAAHAALEACDQAREARAASETALPPSVLRYDVLARAGA